MTEHPAPTTDIRTRGVASLRDWIGAWEVALFGLLVATLVFGSISSRYLLTGANFTITAEGSVGIGLMVVPMAWLMIAGEIDLSVASMFGLSGVVFGLLIQGGAGLIPAAAASIAVGALGGLVNAFFAVQLGLPSLIVTVGTLSVYRGLAYVLLQTASISGLPPDFTAFCQGTVAGSIVPNTLLIFLVLALVGGLFLQRGSIGRKVYAIGSSAEVSRFSGLRVRRVKVGLFIFSGVVASIAGILYSGYVNNVRADNGTGLELTVIGIVLIGGVSMFGGKGRILGVLLSLLLVTLARSFMNLQYVATNLQFMVVGLLMIGAVVVPALIASVPVLASRATNGRRPSLSSK